MSVPSRYPPAQWEPVDYIGSAGPMVPPVRGWVLHVQDGNNDPGPMFSAAVRPNRRFSHLWVSKSGRVAQYQLLTRESWAQGAGGNPSWWSVETEGRPWEALTDAQLDALAAWHVWCGAPDVASTSPAVGGIGTHGMGGASWGGHPDCPGPIRAGQRSEILRRAAALRTGGAMAQLTPDDADTVWQKDYSYGKEHTTPLVMLRTVFNTVRDLDARIAALEATVTALQQGAGQTPAAPSGQ